MKLAAVLLVPAVLAAVLGVVEVRHQILLTKSYAKTQQLAGLRGGLRSLVEAVETERALAAARLGGGTAADQSAFEQQTKRVDDDRAAVEDTAGRTSLEGASVIRYADAVGLLGELPALRQRVDSAALADRIAVSTYGTIINGLLDLDQALTNQFGAAGLSGPATALYDLQMVREQVSLEEVVVLMAFRHNGQLDPDLAGTLRASDVRLQDKLAEFATVASPDEWHLYQQTVPTPGVTWRAHQVDAALAQPPASAAAGGKAAGAGTLPFSAEGWTQSSETTASLVGKVETGVVDELGATTAQLQDRASDFAGEESVLLFAALLVGLAIGVVIGRQLLGSLAVLTSTALDVAEHRLPAVIAGIIEGGGRAPNAEIDRVPVHTTDELGQLARAFDAAHGQAVSLAAEQARLRSDLKSTLVNVSRRSQGLVDRQLSLMEQLERHEEDPDQLANLFKLDHLATRMRRNNENLMILAGGALVRPAGQTVPLGNVLRAAVSEIEHYQRVTLQPAPSVDLIGYVAGDVARLLAELLDNATAFSPPDSWVVIGSAQEHDGGPVRIDIRDRGIGMSDVELAKANQRAGAGSSVEVPSSRQMGLFVVGRLAGRHGITVELSTEPEAEGLRAVVRVPAELVRATREVPAGWKSGRPDTPVVAAAAARQTPAGTAAAAALPRRVRNLPHRSGGRVLPGGPGTPAGGLPQRDTAAPPPSRSAHQDEAPSSWFAAARQGTPPESTEETDRTQAGLPRRAARPRPDDPNQEQADLRSPVDKTAKAKAADRAHKFLSSYQAGIRQAHPGGHENRSTHGQENP